MTLLRPRLAWLTIGCLAWFVAAVVVLHLLRPDVDVLSRVTSEYAVGPYGFLMSSAYVAISVALVALGLGLGRALSVPARRSAGVVLLFLAALGVMVASFFPIDVGAPKPVTFSGRMHRFGAIVGFVSMTLSPLLLARSFRRDDSWRDLSWPGVVVGTLGLLGFAAIQIVLLERGLGGIAQRAVLVIVVAWMMMVALRLVALARIPRR